MQAIDHTVLLREAADCRRQALEYADKPEAALLLNIAKAFQDLHAEKFESLGMIRSGVIPAPNATIRDPLPVRLRR